MEREARIARANQLAHSRNWPDALEAYCELSNDGDVFAQTQIAAIHYRGLGRQKNITEAERWYRQAAATGDDYASFRLARFLIDERRYQEAFEVMLRLSQVPYLPASYWLWRLYSEGKGVGKDSEVAKYYLEYASKHDHFRARRDLAMQELKGQHGLSKMIAGLANLVRVLRDAYSLAGSNPDDTRLIS